jgi:hypothetical protein
MRLRIPNTVLLQNTTQPRTLDLKKREVQREKSVNISKRSLLLILLFPTNTKTENVLLLHWGRRTYRAKNNSKLCAAMSQLPRGQSRSRRGGQHVQGVLHTSLDVWRFTPSSPAMPPVWISAVTQLVPGKSVHLCILRKYHAFWVALLPDVRKWGSKSYVAGKKRATNCAYNMGTAVTTKEGNLTHAY